MSDKMNGSGIRFEELSTQSQIGFADIFRKVMINYNKLTIDLLFQGEYTKLLGLADYALNLIKKTGYVDTTINSDLENLREGSHSLQESRTTMESGLSNMIKSYPYMGKLVRNFIENVETYASKLPQQPSGVKKVDQTAAFLYFITTLSLTSAYKVISSKDSSYNHMYEVSKSLSKESLDTLESYGFPEASQWSVDLTSVLFGDSELIVDTFNELKS